MDVPGSKQNQTEIVSDQIRDIIDPVIMHIKTVVNIVGVITNIINCRVFIKQGVRHDSTNICFLCLSLCDLFGCATSLPYELCFVVKYMVSLEKVYTCFCYGTIGMWLHVPLMRVTTWITVYLSMVRTVSVVIPLRVKLIFTPTVTVIYLTVVITISASVQLSYNIFFSIVWVFQPFLNTTVPLIKDSPTARHVMYYKQRIVYQILPIIAVTIVTINTTLLARKLVEVRKWRQNNSSSNNINPRGNVQKDNVVSNSTKAPMASKDIELIKSITAVTTVYLVCVLMGLIPSISITAFPGVSYNGINKNLFYVSLGIRSMFNCINSSINFFFYIRVSTRYKESFAASFTCFSRSGLKDT